MRRLSLLFVSLALLCLLIITASAGGPVFWRISTRADIEKGDARGVSIADNGALMLAPSFAEIFDTKQAYIWSAVADAAGNVYLGTGHEGRIFKVDAAGRGSLLYKTGELDVMALAVDGQGNVYAGTSPDGKVYRVTPGGEAKVFFEPKTKYIWSLAFDPQGRLLVGTGDKGVIFRVTPDGKGTPLISTTQTNITALRIDAAGNIIAGTDPGGLVLRVTPEGKAFTLLDSSQREVRDLAIGRDGAIYALTMAESAGGGASNPTPAPASVTPTVISADEGVTVTISDVQVLDSSSGSAATVSSPRNAGEQAKSAVYRIDPSGVTDVLWDSREITAFALAVEDGGRVLIGTGQKGRIYSTTVATAGVRKPALLVQSPEAQTSRFVRTSTGQIYAACSNLGKLYQLGRETSVASGTYLSTVRDAQTVANWGRLSWIGEGDIEVQTRSGNTSSPDSTWSDWSAASKGNDGVAISSPRARYVQWRATLKNTAGAAPRLREVTLSYLPRNLAPSINAITVLPTGVALQALPQPQLDGNIEQSGLDPQVFGAATQIPPRRVFQRGAISLQWVGEDRNGDTLEYSIYYRAAAGGDYYLLKAGVKENYYTIDANALPDGRYVFKIVASDLPSNPTGLALTDEEETEPIEVDNTPPAVTADAPKVSGNSVEVTFRAADLTSIVRRAEYQLDGGPWKPIFPADGIADSRREEFRVSLSLPDARPHVIALRAFDANANVGSAVVTMKGR